MKYSRRQILARSAAGALILRSARANSHALSDTSLDTTRRLSRLYVQLRDSTRIAIDLWLPWNIGDRRIGTILEPTRYTRSWQRSSLRIEDDDNYRAAELINGAGFALVVADGRGTGASFGYRNGELSETEVRDFGEIIDWIAAQDFSNGRVGAMGISYSGVLTEHLARLRRPSLKAIAPRFSYHDVYGDLCMPGGIYMRTFMRGWAVAMGKADRVPEIVCAQAAMAKAASCEAYVATLPQPRPVDGNDGVALLRAAQAEHAANVSFPLTVEKEQLYFKDDRTRAVSWGNMSPEGHAAALTASRIPYYVQASWHDRGSAGGALRRFVRLRNAQFVEIGPWSHGSGGYIADTMAEEHGTRARPLAEQLAPILDFFAQHLGESGERDDAPKRLRYYVMGEAAWYETSTWPPAGTQVQHLHLSNEAVLRAEPPARGEDVRIAIKEDHGTGRTGRWGAAWNGRAILFDRNVQTRGLTAFRTAPLTGDLRLVGHVRCSFEIVSDQSDGTLLAYLDAISPDGALHYLSEGALRFIHRLNPRIFGRRRARRVTPGKPFLLQFEMHPVAARIAKGWRLQLSFSDRDVDNLDRYDDGRSPMLMLRIAPRSGSWIELPTLSAP